MALIGEFASIVGVIQFGAEILIIGYGFLRKVRRAHEDISGVLVEVGFINCYLLQLEAKAEADRSPALQALLGSSTRDTYRKLLEDVNKSVEKCKKLENSPHRVKNFVGSMLWPFKEESARKTLDSLRHLRDTLSAALIQDTHTALEEVQKCTGRIDANTDAFLAQQDKLGEDISALTQSHREERLERHDRKLRDWLCEDEIDQEKDHMVAIGKRYRDTGEWFLQCNDFQEWRRTKNAYLWLHGIVGCGKTVLASAAIEDLRSDFGDESTGLAYFYCSKGTRSFRAFLCTIVSQLLRQKPACMDEIRLVLMKTNENPLGPYHGQNSPQLGDDVYINLTKLLSQSFERLFIVVDALDESEDHEYELFARRLKDLTTTECYSTSSIQVLVTGRDGPNYEEPLRSRVTSSVTMEKGMRQDISTYLSQELEQRIHNGKLEFDISQKNIVIEKLEKKANGMILLASHQLDLICQQHSEKRVFEALERLPRTIGGMYEKIMRPIMDRRIATDTLEELQTVLYWLVGSVEPLTLPGLAHAVSIRLGDKSLDRTNIAKNPERLLDDLGSLVTTSTTARRGQESSIKTVKFAHNSFREYLTSTDITNSCVAELHVDPMAVEWVLAKTCIQYLGFDDFQKSIPDEKLKSTSKTDRVCETRDGRKSRYALVQYAATNFLFHLQKSQVSIDVFETEGKDLLRWFLERGPQYASWQQIYYHKYGNYRKREQRHPLYYAIKFNIYFLIDLLLPPENEIDSLSHGLSPLHVAARAGSLRATKKLLDAGAKIDLPSQRKPGGMTALHFAAVDGHVSVVQALLAAGASPHAETRSGATPFWRAARNGSVEVLQILHEAGSDVNKQIRDGWTPVHEAVKNKNVTVIAKLLECGADPSITIKGKNETAITAAERTGQVDVVEMLRRSANTSGQVLNPGTEG